MKDNGLYGQIPYVNKNVSRIVFGTAIEPMLYGKDCDELLDAAVENGINTFDTARNYAGAEISLGKWMERRGNRKEIVILSKCGHPDANGSRINEKAIREDFAKSSEYLHTDYIDIYLLHRDDETVPVGKIAEILNAMHAEGKIGVFGGSNWSHRRIAEANEYAYKHNLIPFTVSSPNYGLAHQVQDPWGGNCVTISGDENEEAREWYRQTGMVVVAYSSLGRGFFSGRIKSGEAERAKEILDNVALKAYDCQENYERLKRCEILAKKKGLTVAQIAMRWIFEQGVNAYAVVSANHESRLKENVAALSITMTREEADYLDLKKEL